MTREPDREEQLDRYIDALNDERTPERPGSAEVEALLSTVRSVKALREPAPPSPEFEERLLGRRRRRWWTIAGAVAAVLLVALMLPSLTRRDVAAAMVQAVEQVQRYHGTLEKRWVNAAGEEQLIYTEEIWVDGDRYAVVRPDGTTVVNNGERKWEIRPADRVVAVLPVAPDPGRIGLDIRLLGDDAREYPSRVVGREVVAGREANILEISPQGGDPYRVWVDAETDLPVRLVTAMQNGIQTIYTFTELEVNQPVDPARFAFRVPEGYAVREDDPGQQVTTLTEAAAHLGFEPVLPGWLPDRMIAYSDRLVAEYGETSVVVARAEGEFSPARWGAIGRLAGGAVEVLREQLRWRQDGLEVTVTGPEAEMLARSIAPGIELPDPGAPFPQEPAFAVEVDLEVAESSQRQLDGGHMPWQVDPTQVAMSFLGSQGIPVDVDSFILAWSTGVRAVVEIPEGPIGRVYLERLVRQDFSGIWSVVGYDPRP